MMVVPPPSIFAATPLIEAFYSSDLFGKLIFFALFLASIISWSVILYKLWFLQKAKKDSLKFYAHFAEARHAPLSITMDLSSHRIPNNPFLHLYALLKKHTVDLIKKNSSNKTYEPSALKSKEFLFASDVVMVENRLVSGILTQTQLLESNLFILSTIVSLAPFLGLLGTVWGIFMTFSQLHMSASANQAIMDGISMALATTVCGLLDAIPALIGYNYLKSSVRSFTTEMDCFCHELLTAIEMRYRKES